MGLGKWGIIGIILYLCRNIISNILYILFCLLGIGGIHLLRNSILVMKIRGLSFSWKRAVGITAAKQKISRKTGIPTTKQGLERKVGKMVLDAIFGKKR